MAHAYDGIRDELRSVARDVLTKDRPAETEIEWSLLARAGWVGLEASENVEGAGATFRETAVILEEMGRAATRSSYLGGAVLGVGTLNKLVANTCRDDLLKDAVTGAATIAVTFGADTDGDAGAVDVPFTIDESADGLRVHGRVDFVPDADAATRILLIAKEPSGTPVIVNIAAQSAGLTITPEPVLDETRRFAVVIADGVAIDEAAVWRFDGEPRAQVCRLLDRAAVAVACDSLGLSEAMLSATTSYASTRHQFARPIGSFQAVKHACADMLVRISVARQLVSAAVEAIADDRSDAKVAAAMAKSYACGAAVDVVGKAMQLHGGIGYTWESGIHVFLKRAALNRSIFGSPATHRKQLAQRYLSELGV
jgi:alkylation response protein AidB-like acyl-CoA dehydrogenase